MYCKGNTLRCPLVAGLSIQLPSTDARSNERLYMIVPPPCHRQSRDKSDVETNFVPQWASYGAIFLNCRHPRSVAQCHNPNCDSRCQSCYMLNKTNTSPPTTPSISPFRNPFSSRPGLLRTSMYCMSTSAFKTIADRRNEDKKGRGKKRILRAELVQAED